MKRYEEYKDTGIGWIPELPHNWDTKKISSLFDERRTKVSDKDYAPLSVSKSGITPQLETAVKSDNGDNRKLVVAGDFVVNSRSDRKGSCGISPLTGSVSLINIVLHPRREINGNYFHYLSRSNNYIEEYYRLGRGIVADLWTTRYSELKSIYIPYPPLAEQEKIVRFLEEKTSKIDALLEEKGEQIQLLNELKESEIANIITRGLNPDVKMKDSRIPWLDSIPEHWGEERAKYLFNRENRPISDEDDIITCFRDGQVTLRKNRRTTGFTESFKECGYQGIRKGDLVIHQMDAFAGSVGISDSDGKGTPVYIVCTPKRDDVYNPYFALVIREMGLNGYIQSLYRGIRERSSDFKFDVFRQQCLPLPPIEEQIAIVSHIEGKVKKVNSLINELESEIEFLREYKQKLIADCVTGQINVQSEI